MNKKQEMELQYTAALLSRKDENNNPVDLSTTHKAIKKIVADIYKGRISVQTVLLVEQILSAGYANVAGNARGAEAKMTELTEKAAIGLDVYKTFANEPEIYVRYVDMANRGIGKSKGEGRRFADGVPVEPVRAAFTQFRKQLTADLTQIDQAPDRKGAARLRFDATITGERLFLGEYLTHRQNEPERDKQEHLRSFGKRMERLTREIEPRACL